MNLWNINKLKDDLSNQKVNQRDLLIYYFLTGLLFAIILLPIDPPISHFSPYQAENYIWIDWGVTNFIYLLTIFLCFIANKGSMGNNFLERIISLEIILMIRYFVFFDIPSMIFHIGFLEETAYSDIGNLIFTIISYLIISIRTIQCMYDIQKI
tara:strand:+ start:274 stop:735 length:462 start_codon:yes stop_codon:yes gene_type:complete